MDGAFKSCELATYPEGLCRFIAQLIVDTLKRFITFDIGPSGCMRLGSSFHEACPRLSHWSTTAGPEREKGISIINELAVKREGVVLTQDQGGLYLHVDDGLIIYGAEAPTGRSERAAVCPDVAAAESTNHAVTFGGRGFPRGRP